MVNAFMVQLPKYTVPEGLDVAPLTNAFAQVQQARQFGERQALDVRRQQLAENQDQRADATHDQDMQARTIKQIAGQAQLIDQEQDPAKRQGMWGKLTTSYPNFRDALSKNGIDPADHVNGPKFLVAQAQGPRDPAADELKAAQADYYRQSGQARATAAGARADNATTNRFRVVANVLDKFGERPTEAMWQQESQPGGLLHVAFGGRVPSYTESPAVLAQFRSEAEKEFEPTEREKIMGITREMKIKGAEQGQLSEEYGLPKRGFVWQRNPDGTVDQVLKAQPTKPVDPSSGRTTKYHLETLNKAEEALLNKNYITRGIGQYYNIGEAGQAAQDYKQAILGLVYEKSGKQTHVSEMKMWLDTYGPQVGDTAWRLKEKSDRLRDYMKAQFDIDIPRPGAAKKDPAPGRSGKAGDPAAWSIRRLD